MISVNHRHEGARGIDIEFVCYETMACRRESSDATARVKSAAFCNVRSIHWTIGLEYTTAMASADSTPDSAKPRLSSLRRRPATVVWVALVLLGTALLVCLGSDAYHQRRAIKHLRKLGVTVKVDVSQAGPKIIRRWIGEGHMEAFGRIQNLNCSDHKISDADIPYIKCLDGLEWLALNRCTITDDGVKQLSEIGTLRALRIDGTSVTDVGLAPLIELRRLEVLSLNRTQISDAGLQYLKKLPRLRHLELNQTQIDDAAIPKLKELEGLQELRLGETNMSPAGVAELQRTHGIRMLQAAGTKK